MGARIGGTIEQMTTMGPNSTGPRSSARTMTVQIVEDERGLVGGDPVARQAGRAAVVAEARPEGGP